MKARRGDELVVDWGWMVDVVGGRERLAKCP